MQKSRRFQIWRARWRVDLPYCLSDWLSICMYIIAAEKGQGAQQI